MASCASLSSSLKASLCSLARGSLMGSWLGIVTLFFAACGSSSGDAVCQGSECQCPGSGDCQVDCRGDCDLACAGSGDCDFLCGDGCETTCSGSGECLLGVGDASTV